MTVSLEPIAEKLAEHFPDEDEDCPKRPKQDIKWSNVIILTILHSLCVIGYVYVTLHPVKFATFQFAVLLGILSGIGLTVGAHRLWAHRSFKARVPLKILLVILNSMSMSGSAFSFARDHRTHHKFSDTEADPKNPTRGLFYSHIGWWMLKKTDAVKAGGNKLDFSDLYSDPILYFQHRYYIPLFVLFGLVLPTWIPVHYFGEDPLVAFFVCAIIRIVVALHNFFTVNSIAHFFGYRPYDFRMRPAENRLVTYLSLGEGNHNYHHTFPFDYVTSEKAPWEHFNLSSVFIDLNRAIGLAYDCKRASKAVIEGTIRKRGIVGHAAFDPPGSLMFRIANGVFDYFTGLLVSLYPAYLTILVKFIMAKPIFVF